MKPAQRRLDHEERVGLRIRLNHARREKLAPTTVKQVAGVESPDGKCIAEDCTNVLPERKKHARTTRPRIFCSKRCQGRDYQRRKREAEQPAPEKPAPYGRCARCNDPLPPPPRNNKPRLYCRKACANAAWKQRQKNP